MQNFSKNKLELKLKYKNICPHKNLYTNVQVSIVHNSPKPGTAQMSLKWRMDKQNVV